MKPYLTLIGLLLFAPSINSQKTEEPFEKLKKEYEQLERNWDELYAAIGSAEPLAFAHMLQKVLQEDYALERKKEKAAELQQSGSRNVKNGEHSHQTGRAKIRMLASCAKANKQIIYLCVKRCASKMEDHEACQKLIDEFIRLSQIHAIIKEHINCMNVTSKYQNCAYTHKT